MPWKKVTNPIQPGDGSSLHGTFKGYNLHGCRCDDCREANAAHSRKYHHPLYDRIKPGPKAPPLPPLSRYVACETCESLGRPCTYHSKKSAGMLS